MSRRDDPLERLLRQAAAEFAYPPTPDLVSRLRGRQVGAQHRAIRRWAVAFAVAAVLLLAALATPPVRAVIYRVLQIGVVHILVDATPTPHPTRPSPSTPPADLVRPDQLGGAMTLAAAARQVDFPLQLPTYPPDLGPPDRVFVQDFGGASVVLVWLDGAGAQVELALFELHSRAVVTKVAPRVLEQTTVGGRPAIWATGPYLVMLGNGSVEVRRLIGGQVLIWEEDGVTYRLETAAGLEEARRIAESLASPEGETNRQEPGEEP